MDENKVKNLINALDIVNEQMVQKKEISTIAVAVKLEGLDQINEELDKVLNKLEKANSLADELALKIKDLCSKTILSDEWRELIVEDAKTKEKLVIINSDGVEITSSDLNVRLVPEVRIDPDELKVLAKPLQEYLTNHFNPMCSVVVDVDRVTVVSKELFTPTDQTRRYECLCWNVFSACPNDGEEMKALYSDSLTLQ